MKDQTSGQNVVTWGREAGNAGLFTRYQLPSVYNHVQHFAAVNNTLLQFTAEEITNESCCGGGEARPALRSLRRRLLRQ